MSSHFIPCGNALRRMMIAVAASAALGAPIACGNDSSKPPPTDPCGSATPLKGGYAQVGRLTLQVSFPGAFNDPRVWSYRDGYPTKVPVGIPASLRAPVSLTGRSCTDSQPLRVWYPPTGSGTPFEHVPVGADVLASTGDLSASFDNPAPGLDFVPGLILFSRSGKWVVTARRGDKVLGTATLLTNCLIC